MKKWWNKIRKREWNCTPMQLVLLGFLGAILVGTLLLCLPFATADGHSASFLDALFTATTSVCVTGLVVVETATYWSLFGQIIILILIQCGGLGIISFTTATLLVLRKKVTLRDRVILEEALNLSSLSGLLRFLKKVFLGTFVIEGIGAVASAFTFIPAYGLLKGIWFSVFHSISSFCNAGLDLLGPDSLIPYRYNFGFNITTMLLIIAGGIGFPVWWDLIQVARDIVKRRRSAKRAIHHLKLHSKIVLTMTLGLILAGALVVFLVERNNPGTLQGESLPHQILMSLFQSVTLRTAGFCSIPQQNLTNAGTFFSMIWMFVGGSPIGTAGGIKTTTLAVLIMTVWGLVRGRDDTTVYGRTISQDTVRKAMGVAIFSLGAVCFAVLILLSVEDGNFLDIVYEVFSATGTVGLSRNFTASMSTAGRVVIIICMYLGRIGPITLAMALGRKRSKGKFSYPIEEIPVG